MILVLWFDYLKLKSKLFYIYNWLHRMYNIKVKGDMVEIV